MMDDDGPLYTQMISSIKQTIRADILFCSGLFSTAYISVNVRPLSNNGMTPNIQEVGGIY